ncbi:diguanylate cyclase [Marinobacteraceae bacterium S3BR75-40.1]
MSHRKRSPDAGPAWARNQWPQRVVMRALAAGLVSILLLLQTALADPLTISAGTSALNSGGGLFTFRTDRTLSLNDVRALAESRWTPQATLPNFGLTRDTVWLRFRLRMAKTEAESWVVRVANPHLNEVDFYLLREHAAGAPEPVRQYHSGNDLPFSQRPLRDNTFAFPIVLKPGAQYSVYLKVRSNNHLRLPLQLLQERRYLNQELSERLLQGAYFGLVLIMAMGSLVIFFSIRDKSYLYYTGFLMVVGLWVFIMRGYAYEYLWPQWPWWNERAYAVFMAAGAGMSVLFTRDFLSLRKHHKGLFRITTGLCWVWVLLTIFAVFQAGILTLKLISIVLMGGGGLLLYTGLAMWRRGLVEARYYVCAWTIIIIGAMAVMASHLGLLPGSNSAFNLFQVGSALEGFLLSLGLAARLNMKWKARAEAEQRALKLTAQMQRKTIAEQERHAQELESHVAARTHELQQALEQLGEANAELTRLSTTDPLTGLHNRRYLTERLEQEWKLGFRNQTPLSLLLMDIDHFKQINDTYGHVVGDACLKQMAAVLAGQAQRSADIVARFGGEEFIVILPDTHLDGARHVAERIRQEIAALQVQHDQSRVRMTVSIGVACAIPQASVPPERLLTAVDDALYRAKAEGRNRVCAPAADQA